MVVLHLLWCAIKRRRRSHIQSPRSVNGGMERSSRPGCNRVCTSPEICSAIGRNPAPRSAQLGCVNLNHGQRASYLTGCQPSSSRVRMMRLLDYDTLAEATADFNSSRQLKKFNRGSSSDGTMFRGTMVSDEGLETPVVIKKFHHRFTDDEIMQVRQDLNGHVLRHRNLLCPLGCSLRKGKLYVVYEYMTNDSLDQHLVLMKSNPNHGLSWERCCRIINGIAVGLHHLHHNNAIHGAVKVSNILLDQDMTARLGDFGYSRDASSPVTLCRPTYEMDVFYFGAVILEIVSGILDTHSLVDWVWAHHHDGNILGVVDAKLAAAGDFKEAEAQKLLLVGLACSHPEPKDRPGMGDVVDILKGKAPLPSVPAQKPTYEAGQCGYWLTVAGSGGLQ